MNNRMFLNVTITLFLFFNITFFSSICLGNTGVFYGSGNQVIPIKNDQIQLVKEKVNIKLTVDKDSGRFGVPFIPWANVTAKFYFKNTAQNSVSLQIGFPFLDLQGFGDEKYVLENLNFRVVSNGKEKVTELKEGIIEKKFDPNGLFKKVFSWQEEFQKGEEKEVIVSYRMLMGVASANSIFRNFDEEGQKFRSIDKMFPALSYSFSYITRTAYTWAGDIEEAVFQLDCSAFYQELESQDFMVGIGDEKPGYERPLFWEATYPESAIKDDGIYKWVFNRSVPEDGLSFSAIVFFVPSQPSELNNYISTNLSRLESVTPEEFKKTLAAFYRIIAFDEQPTDDFLQKYFKDVRFVKMPKTFIFEKDKDGVEKIARNFEKVLK